MAWNGTEYVHHYGGHATDIVGYAYCADTYCPRCTLALMGSVSTLPPRQAIVESEIRIWGAEIRDLTDPEDPRWRDSDMIPQPIFLNDACDEDDKPYTCASCHEGLVES